MHSLFRESDQVIQQKLPQTFPLAYVASLTSNSTWNNKSDQIVFHKSVICAKYNIYVGEIVDLRFDLIYCAFFGVNACGCGLTREHIYPKFVQVKSTYSLTRHLKVNWKRNAFRDQVVLQKLPQNFSDYPALACISGIFVIPFITGPSSFFLSLRRRYDENRAAPPEIKAKR